MTTIPYLEEELEKTTKQLNYYKNYSNRLLNDNKKKDKEIERLKEENKRIFSKVNDDQLLRSNAMNYAEAQDYKSRCERAMKLLKEFYDSGSCPLRNISEAYEILNGGDKSE